MPDSNSQWRTLGYLQVHKPQTIRGYGNTVWHFDFTLCIFFHWIKSQMGSDGSKPLTLLSKSRLLCKFIYAGIDSTCNFFGEKKVLSLFIIAEKYINLKRGFTSGNFWHDLTFYTIIFCDFSCTSSLTLYIVILRIARNFLETRENIKLSTHPFYHMNLDWFSFEWSKKKQKKAKKYKMADSKNWDFQNRQFSKIFAKISQIGP